MTNGYESSFEAEGPRRRKVVARPASQIRREPVEWLIQGRVPLGMVTVLSGVGGRGKSTLTALWAAENPGVTLIATAEDSLGATVRPRLEAAEADLNRVRFVLVRTEDGIEDGIAIPDDVAQLEEIVVETGATLVVVDPLVAHLPGTIDSFKDQAVRRALAPLHRLAEAQGCAVVVIVHLNKAQGLAPLQRLSGSSAFGNAARSVLLLDRDPDDDENGLRRVLALVKSNVGPEQPSLLYEIEPIVLPESDGEPRVETARLALVGVSEHDGASLLALSSGDARTQLDEACDFLRVELGEGCAPAAEMLQRGRRLGHSEPTLRRAREKLGIETSKEGFEGHWKWCLPKASSTLTPSYMTPSQEPHSDADSRSFETPKASPSTTDAFERNGVTLIGDDDFLPHLFAALEAERITEAEFHEADRAHRLIVQRRSS